MESQKCCVDTHLLTLHIVDIPWTEPSWNEACFLWAVVPVPHCPNLDNIAQNGCDFCVFIKYALSQRKIDWGDMFETHGPTGIWVSFHYSSSSIPDSIRDEPPLYPYAFNHVSVCLRPVSRQIEQDNIVGEYVVMSRDGISKLYFPSYLAAN